MLHALASGGGSSSTLAMPAGGGGARERHALATGSSPAGSMNMEELLFNMAFFADAQQSGNIGSLLRSTLEESANAESLESSGRDAVSGHLSPASVEVVEMLKERQTMYSGPSAARSVLKDTPSSPRTGEKLARREATSEEDEKATESMKEGELDCDDECPVCADEFQAGDQIVTLPDCRHTFHAACVFQWLELQSNCPMCRSSITGASGQTPASGETDAFGSPRPTRDDLIASAASRAVDESVTRALASLASEDAARAIAPRDLGDR